MKGDGFSFLSEGELKGFFDRKEVSKSDADDQFPVCFPERLKACTGPMQEFLVLFGYKCVTQREYPEKQGEHNE